MREYTSEVPSRELLERVIDATRHAPSACNRQPWHFYVITDKNLLSELKSAYAREWIQTAQAMIVVVGNHTESWHRADGKDHCDIDIAIAVDHLTLVAHALGLGTCWICNFGTKKVANALKISGEQEVIAMLPIGYPACEIKKNTRKAMAEMSTFI